MIKVIKNEDGVAAIEFALVAPVMIFMFMGAVDLCNLLIIDNRVRHATAVVSDLVTQSISAQISPADLNVANTAAAFVMSPLPITSKFAMVITNYRPTNATTSQVKWSSIIYAGGASPTRSSQLGLSVTACGSSTRPANLPMPAAATMNDIVMVQARYDWTPMFTQIITSTLRLNAVTYNMVRYSQYLEPSSTASPMC